MTHTPTFRIRYATGLAILLTALGPVLLVLGGLTSNVMTMVIGGLDLMLGIGMLFQPAFVLDKGVLNVRNLLGMTLRRLPVTGPAGQPVGFSIEKGGALIRWTHPAGRLRPVKMARFGLHKAEFAAFTAWVKTGVFG